MSRLIILSLCGVLLNVVNSDVDYGKYVPGCHVKDADFNECLQKSLQRAIQVSHKGIPEFNINDLEPFDYPDFSIKNPLGISYKLSNAKYYGFTTYILQKVRAVVEKYYFEIAMTAPVITLIGDYEISGKLIALPVNGHGRCNLTLLDLQYFMKIQGEPYTSDDDKLYMKVKQVTSSMKMSKIITYLDKPFKNNKPLNEVVNQLLNQHWKDLFEISRSDFDGTVNQIMYDNLQKYFSRIPYKVIFPD